MCVNGGASLRISTRPERHPFAANFVRRPAQDVGDECRVATGQDLHSRDSPSQDTSRRTRSPLDTNSNARSRDWIIATTALKKEISGPLLGRTETHASN